MTVSEFISRQSPERQATLKKFHELISAGDTSVEPAVKPMMGKDMILFEERCYMKYGLASTKAYLSLHCLPLYMNPALYQKFEPLLPKAKLQKGCINFKDEAEFPAAVLAQLIADCAEVSIADALEKRRKK